MNTVKILPSVMCCEAAEQKGYLKAFEESGVTAIHFDVMDGHYVPNVMLGIRDYNEMKKQTSLPIDVHMMTDKPEEFFEIFQPQAGDWVSFHPETAVNPYRLLQAIRERGCRAGGIHHRASQRDRFCSGDGGQSGLRGPENGPRPP